ncbi:hypothetical protein F4775DRAFT_572051 [Biscogniauxia sp. FL1348]|nr:hypothetical protein F4775DRAFT_572051 [Biscogniauxia sp. FL1348]
MADPISLAGLGLSIASLGLQVCGGITTYLDAVRCRDEEIASVKQQNETLIKTLQVIRNSLSCHASTSPLPDAMSTCLKLFETRLGDLQILATELTNTHRPDDGLGKKVKDQGKLIWYPFKRPKLQQLEDKLSRANEALQLALQAFGIDISLGNVEKLVTIETDTSSISAELQIVKSEIASTSQPIFQIHDSLPTVQKAVESLGPLISLESGNLGKRVLEGVGILGDEVRDVRDSIRLPLTAQQEQLSRIEMQNVAHLKRLDRLEHLIIGLGDEGGVTPERAIGRLITKPTNLREICDSFSDQKTGTRHNEESNFPRLSKDHKTPISNKLMSFICTCRPQRSMESTRFFGSWLNLYSGTTWKQHLPGCPLFSTRATSQRQICIRSTGLARLLGSAIEVTFTLSSGAGGFSIGPNFTYYPTVNSSRAPAFRIMALLGIAAIFTCKPENPTSQWGDLLVASIARIAKLFREGRASPLAVNEDNENLNHVLGVWVGRSEYVCSANICHTLEVLETLIKLGVPINSYDCRGISPFLYFARGGGDRTMDAAEIIFQSTTETVLAATREERIFPACLFRVTRVFAKSPVLAESYGCGPLSMAVLANDTYRVEYLLAHQPSALNERNQFGQSPLHLAADKPTCLTLLIRAVGSAQINCMDAADFTVLETAMVLSSANCLNGDQRVKCSGCGCADSMKDRRQKLKELALRNLCHSDIIALNLRKENVLDAYAPRVVELLRQRNIQIPDSIMITIDRQSGMYTSIYRALQNYHDANEFFEMGFGDVDVSDGNAYPLAMARFYGNEYVKYISWLIEHGANLYRLVTWTKNTHKSKSCPERKESRIIHRVFFRIGYVFWRHWRFGETIDQYSLRSISKLNRMALLPNLVDCCRCLCSPGGCTPFTKTLRGMCDSIMDPHRIIDIFSMYLKEFWSDLSTRHHSSAIRCLTFSALGITHACCDQKPFGPIYLTDVEIDEIHEEKGHLLALLEELLEEFEPRVTAVLSKPDRPDELIGFLEGYWLNRMTEVLESLDGDDISEEECQAARNIGVIWDDPQPLVDSNPYDKETIEHWYYELDQIESEPPAGWFSSMGR